VLVLDITLIDVFLFFACVALLDLHALLDLFAVDRGAVLVPPRLHGDGGAQGHQEILASLACPSPHRALLVLSDEIDATRDWYRDVLGMHEAGIRTSVFPCTGCISRRGRVHIGKSAKDASDNQKAYSAPRQDAGAARARSTHRVSAKA